MISGAWYLLASARAAFSVCVGIGVERVRRHRRHHQRVVAEPREIALGEPERVGGRLGVGHGEADDGLAQHAAHSGLLGHFRHHVLEVVHVGEGGGPAQQHFEATQARAPAHELRRDVLGFRREDVLFEPVLEPHVVRDSPEQRHGGVRVGVDQARRQDGVRTVQALLGLEALVDFGLRADAHDAVAANGHGAVLNHAALRVFGDDVASAPDPVGGLRAPRRRA